MFRQKSCGFCEEIARARCRRIRPWSDVVAENDTWAIGFVHGWHGKLRLAMSRSDPMLQSKTCVLRKFWCGVNPVRSLLVIRRLGCSLWSSVATRHLRKQGELPATSTTLIHQTFPVSAHTAGTKSVTELGQAPLSEVLLELMPRSTLITDHLAAGTDRGELAQPGPMLF